MTQHKKSWILVKTFQSMRFWLLLCPVSRSQRAKSLLDARALKEMGHTTLEIKTWPLQLAARVRMQSTFFRRRSTIRMVQMAKVQNIHRVVLIPLLTCPHQAERSSYLTRTSLSSVAHLCTKVKRVREAQLALRLITTTLPTLLTMQPMERMNL